MHLAGLSYEEAYRTFRWELPARFNIAEAICDRHAAETPGSPALIYEETDGQTTVWSFARLQQAANRLANALRSLGVGPGVIVGLHLPQCPESPIAHIAIQKLGAMAASSRPDSDRTRPTLTSVMGSYRVEANEVTAVPTTPPNVA